MATTTRDERRALAMVATEAAMQAEKDEVRFSRLQLRNALAGGRTLDDILVLIERRFERRSVRALLEDMEMTGILREALFWLKDVDLGLWTPSADLSNCLATPRLDVTLWMLWPDHMQGHSLPRDGGDLVVPIGRGQSKAFELRAEGGDVEIDWLNRKSLVVRDGTTFRPAWPGGMSEIVLRVRRHAGATG